MTLPRQAERDRRAAVHKTGAAIRSLRLSDLRQCARVCEQVLRKGNHDDIRYSINIDQLQQLWHSYGYRDGRVRRGPSRMLPAGSRRLLAVLTPMQLKLGR